MFEDRDRIARDLHDLVIQRLYASGMKLQGTMPMIARPAVEERVSSVVDDLDMTITDIRQAIFALQARGKTAPVLRDKVMDVIDEMTEPMGMSSSFWLTGLDQGVPGDIGEHMLFALREALSNAARHGKATRVEVNIGAGKLRLLVRDNGTGINDATRRSGLANLAQRAEHYGGTLTVGGARAAGRNCAGGSRCLGPHPQGKQAASRGLSRACRRSERRRRRPAFCVPFPASRTVPASPITTMSASRRSFSLNCFFTSRGPRSREAVTDIPAGEFWLRSG